MHANEHIESSSYIVWSLFGILVCYGKKILKAPLSHKKSSFLQYIIILFLLLHTFEKD